MSRDQVDVAQRLYDALNAHDARAIMAVLAPDFVGIASEGMPLGAGGRHEGAEAMLRNCWAKVFAAYDVRLDVEERLVIDDGRVVFTGRYVGTERETGRRLDAAFAHFLRIHGNRLTELVQFTDTARWRSE
jgi:2-(1,2-epoxy-1,2-dihydrophenyl)acetyl-CoA isomerase